MKKLHLYWDDWYINHTLPNERTPSINVAYHIFTAYEMRSLRATEVIMFPKDKKEFALGRALQSEFNKYGVVTLVKNPKEQVA